MGWRGIREKGNGGVFILVVMDISDDGGGVLRGKRKLD